MKNSNLPYEESQAMEHPIYSLRWADNEKNRWERVYHNLVNSNIDTNLKVASFHRLTDPKFINKYADVLLNVYRAKKHYKYVVEQYKKYNNKLTTILDDIKLYKEDIVNCAIKYSSNENSKACYTMNDALTLCNTVIGDDTIGTGSTGLSEKECDRTSFRILD